jgi:hypothetical protein
MAITQKGRVGRFVDAVKAGVDAFRKSAPQLEEPPALRKNPPDVFPFPAEPRKMPERKLHEAGLCESHASLMRPVDVELYSAIGSNDADRIRDAVKRGADLQAKHIWMPKHRDHECIQMETLKPLSYARKIGNLDAIIALTELGAKE